MKLTKEDWEKAKQSANTTLKEATFLEVQGSMLLKRAERELKKLENETKGP